MRRRAARIVLTCIQWMDRIRVWLLWLKFNLHPSIRIARGVYLGHGVKITIGADGFITGGTVTIAAGVRLADGVIVAPYGGKITICENVYIGPYSVIYGHGGLTIGKNTLIAAQTVIIPSNHQFDRADLPIRNQGESRKGIEIQEDVWIGCGARILDGVTLGKGAVIGAGAVVNHSIEAYGVAVGVPAKVIRKRTGV